MLKRFFNSFPIARSKRGENRAEKAKKNRLNKSKNLINSER